MEFIDHHLAHACSAFLLSGFKKAIVRVIDGAGEENCISAYLGNGICLNKVFTVPNKNTLGLIYQRRTKLLGLKRFEDEYKVMGLSAFGKPTYLDLFIEETNIRENILEIKKGLLSVTNMEELTKIRRRNKNEPIMEEHKDFACSLQKFLEYALNYYLSYLTKEYQYENLCYSGGVALNCVANENLRKFYKNIFIQPAGNDAGTSLGSALFIASKKEKNFQNKKMINCFFGPRFSDSNIQKFLDHIKVKYERLEFPEINVEISNDLHAGKIIAWFQDRMEWGPRALGNRSILADPSKKEIREKINLAIKHREPFRPFAPSVLFDHYSDYFEGDPNGREFMLFVSKVKEDKINEIPAVVHIDNTSRVQTITKKFNLKFYNLIYQFYELTGIPLLLNTSFNVNQWITNKGNPIVMDPTQTICDFFNSGLETLVMGPFIIRK